MTLSEVIDTVHAPGTLKSLCRNALRTFAPGVLDKAVCVEIDRQSERLRIWLGEALVVDQGFDALETYATAPKQD